MIESFYPVFEPQISQYKMVRNSESYFDHVAGTPPQSFAMPRTVRPDEMNKSVNLSDTALYLFGTGLPSGLY